MINLKLLRFVQEVARAGSIRKAATRLNISSSALNRQILALEEELDTQLFERMPKRLRLTASGEAVVAYAQSTAKEHNRLLGRISALKGMQSGVIRIATMGGLVNGPLLKLANSFVAQHSKVLLRIDILPSPDAIAGKVLAGDCDIGLGYNFVPNPALRVLQSMDVEVGIVVAATHPLATSPSPKLADCIEYPIATGSESMVIRDVVEFAFASAGLPMQPTMETDSIEVMKQFAVAGHCVTFLNPMDISAEQERGELVYRPLAERHFPTPSLKLVVRSKGSLEAAAGRLAEDIRNRMAVLTSSTSGGA